MSKPFPLRKLLFREIIISFVNLSQPTWAFVAPHATSLFSEFPRYFSLFCLLYILVSLFVELSSRYLKEALRYFDQEFCCWRRTAEEPVSLQLEGGKNGRGTVERLQRGRLRSRSIWPKCSIPSCHIKETVSLWCLHHRKHLHNSI